MDAECAFCGRGLDSRHQVYCDDCQLAHSVCGDCAHDVTVNDDAAGLRLVA